MNRPIKRGIKTPGIQVGPASAPRVSFAPCYFSALSFFAAGFLLPLCFFALLFFLPLPIGAEGNAHPLTEIWRLAEKNMPALQARARESEANRLYLKTLPNPWLPDVRAEVGYAAQATHARRNEELPAGLESVFAGESDKNEYMRHGPLARLVARWTVWDGGRTRFRRALGTERYRIARLRRSFSALRLKKNLSALYYRGAYLGELNRLSRENREALQRLRPALFRLMRIGRIGPSILEDLKIRGERLLAQEKRRENAARTIRLRLALFAGLEKPEALAPPTLALPFSPNDAKNLERLKFESTPAFLLARARSRALQARKKLSARELYWPSVSLEVYGGYGPHRDAIQYNKPEAGFSFALRLPLLSRRDRGARLRRRGALIAAAKLDAKQELLAARLEFGEKRARVGRDEKYLIRLSELIRRAAINALRARREFARGQRAPMDAVESLAGLYRMKREAARVKSELLLRKTELYLFSRTSRTDSRARAKSPSRPKKESRP